MLNTPEVRRLVESQALVAHFKMATTARRFDKANSRWIDGDSLRVRVNCWRQLAENVHRSVHTGDPVIITGRLYSRDWQGEDHIKRVSYELDAFSVGHDLARGRAKFVRVRANTSTSAIDDGETDQRIGGEFSEPVTELNALARRRRFDAELGGFVTAVDEYPMGGVDPFADEVLGELHRDEAGSPFGPTFGGSGSSNDSDDSDDSNSSDDADSLSGSDGSDHQPVAWRSATGVESDRESDDDGGDDGEGEGAGVAEDAAVAPSRRKRRRVPVAA